MPANPKCPTCKKRSAVELFAKHVYSTGAKEWPGKAIGIHRIYLCPCGQQFTKKSHRRGRIS